MRSGVEVKRLFNLKYQNSNSGQSPDINDYELSLYLTEAKKQVIDFYFSDNLKGSVDETERVKKHLSVLVKQTAPITLGEPLDENAYFKGYYTYKVNLPVEVWRVLEERVVKKDDSSCINSLRGDVKPIHWDILRDTLENPFRRPNAKIVIRTDLNDTHYLISKYVLKEYICVYLAFPTPYIITDLTQFSTDYDLEDRANVYSIDGVTSVSLNELDYFMDDLIINRAVELATKDYKENTLSTNISLNQRSL